MRKLALSDEILLKIEKPARYIGNEVNSAFRMSMKSVCPILEFRYYTICSTAERMYGVNVSILHGRIWTRL